MPRHYVHLTRDKRSQISALKSIGTSNAKIAKQLGIHKTTAGREIKRNGEPNGEYNYESAHLRSIARWNEPRQTLRKMSANLTAIIDPLIREDWSPQQISGWLLKNKNLRISHECIYQYIWEDKKVGGALYKHLRRKGKKYNYARHTKAAGRGYIPHRKDIRERPAIVEEKSRAGDLEIDLIIGKNHQGAVLSIADRATKFVHLVKLLNKASNCVTGAILAGLKAWGIPALTITVDNGKEFCQHRLLTNETGAQVYFATPYHSWERGLIEHTNGLIRQYLPKKSNLMKDITQDDLRKIAEKLNNRPRKVLNYFTPKEAVQNLLGVALTS